MERMKDSGGRPPIDTRDLIQSISSGSTAFLALVPDERDRQQLVCQAVEQMQNAMRPLNEQEPALQGPNSDALRLAVSAIGAKIMPTASTEQGSAWRDAIMLALSDLPPKAVISAARKAIHHVFTFPNEVDGVIRAKAEEIVAKQRDSLRTLHRLRTETERAANPPQPQIEDKAMTEPMSEAEVRQLFTSPMGKIVVRMGVEQGWIPAELVEQLRREQEEKAEGEAE